MPLRAPVSAASADRRTRIAIIVALLLVATTVALVLDRRGAVGPERGENTAAAGCTDVLAVLVPGNREGYTDSGVAPGPTVGMVWDTFREQVSATGRTVEAITIQFHSRAAERLQGAARPTVEARRSATKARWASWRTGVPEAVDLATSQVRNQATRCPQQSLALIGYAQGAEVAHLLLDRVRLRHPAIAERITSTVLVSDSGRLSRTRGTMVGHPAAAHARRGVTATHRRLNDAPMPGSVTGVWTVCRAGDVVCDVAGTPIKEAIARAKNYVAAHAATLRDVGNRAAIRISRIPIVEQTTYHRAVGDSSTQPLAAKVFEPDRSSLRWRAVGKLPAGVRLSEQGVLSGAATSAGETRVLVEVRNTRMVAYSRPIRGYITIKATPGTAPTFSAGGTNTCAVKRDGTLWCWGANTWGQVGDGTRGDRTRPEQVEPNRAGLRWVDVSTSGSHTCGITDRDHLYCWGLNSAGMLGNGSTSQQLRPAFVRGNLWRDVSAGWFSTCGVTKSGGLYCWGDGGKHRLGNGSTANRLTPHPVDSATDWASVEVGGEHACAVKRNGTAWCWGDNLFAQLGDGTVRTRARPVRLATGTYSEVDVSWMHTCGVRTDGRTMCWGYNTNGQLGVGNYNYRPTPTEVRGGGSWAGIGVADSSTCARRSDGKLFCWGDNAWGQLATGSRTRSPVPVTATNMGGWLSFDGGWQHMCGTRTDGALYCWGASDRGQLGDGGPLSRTTPYLVMKG